MKDTSPERVSDSGEYEDEDVEDSPLPAWMEGDSLAPPCQVGLHLELLSAPDSVLF